ncbi:DedA family protein [Vampirovibrio chlorellavorus]|uniref:DedA family protein n=1 Tax=Vampirovibrio chlorellavorus TaxID=758823 RepID=UPI0026EBAFFC|nr:DedA family protein [Vampirovibrio chlorellavorus]
MEFFHTLIELVMAFIHNVIASLGYVGVALLMAIESANVPLPSEFIMPYAGFLVQQGKLNFHLAALAGAVGCVIGSIPSYFIGLFGGRSFLLKYGKWLLLSEHDLDEAERWVDKYGDLAFFICRMLPVVRTFISLPAGILQAHFYPFVLYTFIGSLIWCYGLVYVGVYFGENLEAFRAIWHKFDYAIIGLLVVLGVLYIWKHVKHIRQDQRKLAQQELAQAKRTGQES